jgi:hypothetical protein
LNQLIADFGTGQPSGSSIADATALGDALNFVSQQRVIVDNSLTRLTAATSAASDEQTQLTAGRGQNRHPAFPLEDPANRTRERDCAVGQR